MFISPMLLEKIDAPFDSENHYVQLKLDGIRLILSNVNGLKLYTRHNNEITSRFPELHEINLPPGVILDGELIVTGPDGKPDFEEVMSRFMLTNPFNIKRAMLEQPATFCVFDILYCNGKSVTSLPLYERKRLIESLIDDTKHIVKVKWMDGTNASSLFSLCQKEELEGIVIKDKTSKYEVNKRSWSWQKVINYKEAVVCITGYKKDKFGWLIGIDDLDGRVRPVGTIEFGPSPDERIAFYNVAQDIKTWENKDYVFIDPFIKCRVKFRNWTKSGMIRIPIFQEFVFTFPNQ